MQFTPFLTLLAEIEDPRRAEGKLYRLPHVVLFAILVMVAGANSYRSIHMPPIGPHPWGPPSSQPFAFGVGGRGLVGLVGLCRRHVGARSSKMRSAVE